MTALGHHDGDLPALRATVRGWHSVPEVARVPGAPTEADAAAAWKARV